MQTAGATADLSGDGSLYAFNFFRWFLVSRAVVGQKSVAAATTKIKNSRNGICRVAAPLERTARNPLYLLRTAYGAPVGKGHACKIFFLLTWRSDARHKRG